MESTTLSRHDVTISIIIIDTTNAIIIKGYFCGCRVHHGFNMVSTWFHHGFSMASTWFRLGFNMVSTWFQNDFILVSIWFQHGFKLSLRSGLRWAVCILSATVLKVHPTFQVSGGTENCCSQKTKQKNDVSTQLYAKICVEHKTRLSAFGYLPHKCINSHKSCVERLDSQAGSGLPKNLLSKLEKRI